MAEEITSSTGTTETSESATPATATDAAPKADAQIPAQANPGALGDANSARPQDAKPKEDTAPQEEKQELPPAMVEKAKRLGLDVNALALLGDQAEEFLDRYSEAKRNEMAELGERLQAERDAKAKAEEQPAPAKLDAKPGEATSEKKDVKKEAQPAPDDPFNLALSEEYDDTVRELFGKASDHLRRMDGDQRKFGGYVLQQLQELQGLKQQLWGMQHQQWLQSQGPEWSDTVKDPEFQKTHARKMDALSLAYQSKGIQTTDADLAKEAFDLLTASKTKEAVTRHILNSVRDQKGRFTTPPSRRSSAAKEPATREEAVDKERNEIEDLMVEYGMATKESLNPFTIR